MIPAPAEPPLQRAMPHANDEARTASRRSRVLMTVDCVGGVWRYAIELARALKPQGVDTVFAGLGPRPSREQECEAVRTGELVWTRHPLDWMARHERELDGIPQALEELADALDIDAFHLNLPSQACGLQGARPVVVVSHSCVVTWWKAMRQAPLPPQWLWQQRRNAQGLARADAVVAPSGSHADLMQSCYGPLARLSTVHNGISAFLHGAAKEDFVFAAGRWWDEGKNAGVLDAAAARSPWKVRMAGGMAGPEGQRAKDLRHAQALGELPHMRLLDEIRRAGIVVSPSLYEPFGLAALEGARAGAALVLADIPTYRELWSQAALFFDPRDPDALASAIDRLAGDPDLRREMGDRALARSRIYSPHLQARAMAGIYRALLPLPAPPLARST